jgi:hypothetical protein
MDLPHVRDHLVSHLHRKATFVSESSSARGPLNLVRLDFSPQHRQPTAARVALATVVAIVASLLADALIVVIAERLFPSTKGYVHFQFGDYAKLTIIGVVIASLGWPAACYVSTRARRLYLALAVLVSIAALAPDAWILHQGQSAQAVLVLVWMHLALAVITYLSMVLIAPQRRRAAVKRPS